ncbi:MAG: transcription termination factor Rho [Chloroflexota bacterium]
MFDNLETASGVLETLRRGGGFLRDAAISFQPSADDVWVPNKLIREYGLVDGALVTGLMKQVRKGTELVVIDSICGLSPTEFANRPNFQTLTAIDPDERFQLGEHGDTAMRAIELIAPIGRGSRGLIVAPPKSGKTQLLSKIACAMRASDPDARIVILLLDERPEEVTYFRRQVDAEVLSSTIDQPLESHTNLAELMLAHIRCELECGRNVVVLIDSITRLVRAFNLKGRGSRKTMSGGIDAKAIEIPRRFFGLARNIENGGSVTVIATALIETGSKMDDYIFEEFKSTGNSEIVLDRSLAEARVFPAINLLASGTRKEELLYSEDEIKRLTSLRRWLAGGNPKAAMRGLLKLMKMAETNEVLLEKLNPAR